MAKEGFLGIATKKSSPARNSTPSRKSPGKLLFKRFLCGPSPRSKDSVYAETSVEGPIDSNSTSGSPSSAESTTGTRPSTGTHTTGSSTMKALPDSIPVPESPSRGELKQRISDILSSAAMSPDTVGDDLYLAHSASSYSEEDNEPSTPPLAATRNPDNNSYQNMPTPTSMPMSMSMPMKTPGIAIPTPSAKRFDENLTTSLVFPHPMRAITESPSPEVTRHLRLSQSTSESHATNTNNSEEDEEDDAFLPDDFKRNKQIYTWEDVQRYIAEAVEECKYELEDRHQQELEETLETNLREHGSVWKKDAEAEYARLNNLIKEEKAANEQKNAELQRIVESMNVLEAQLSIQTQEKRRLESKVQGLEQKVEEDVSANNRAKDLYINQLHEQIHELQAELEEIKTNQPDSQHLKSIERAKQEAEDKVDELERMVLRTQNQIKTMELNQYNEKSAIDSIRLKYEKEIKELQAANRSANEQVLSLQSKLESMQRNTTNMEELLIIKSENTTLERKIRELQERLDARTAAVDEQSAAHIAQLQDARAQIQSLEEQLEESKRALNESAVSNASDISHDEFISTKAQVETLQSLHDEDLKEKNELKSRLHRMQQEMLVSPRKAGTERKVEIGTLTVEVLPSPSNSLNQSWSKDDAEALLRLRSELEVIRAHRDTLEAQVRQLDTNDSAEKIRRELEGEIQLLKEELDRRTKQFEAEKRTIQADLSVEEIEELTSEVEALKREHATMLEQQRTNLKAEHERVLKASNERFEELRLGFQEEVAHLVETHCKEKETLQVQITQLKQEHETQLDLVKQASMEQSERDIKVLQDKLDRLRIEFEDEKVEIIRTSSRQADELQTKLSIQQQGHDEELGLMRDTIQNLESQIEQLKADAQSQQVASITTQYLQEMQAKYEDDIDALKIQSQEETAKVQCQLEDALREKVDLESRITNLEKQLQTLTDEHKKQIAEAARKAQEEMDKELQELESTIQSMEAGDKALTNQIAKLQAQTKEDKEEYSRRIRKVREDHNKEIDDLLKQLDLVEAEHHEKISKMQQLVTEKETVISALGTQLAEAERKLFAKSEEMDRMSRRVEDLEAELEVAKTEMDVKANEIKRLITERARAAEDEAILREQLCTEAREEMIQRAEEQFEELNSTYKKLKQKFDEAQDKIANLEMEVKAAKKRADQIKKEKESREEDLATEIAHVKAAIATADLNAARKLKQYRLELQQAKESEQELQAKLDEALATSRSVQRTLASVVSEKEKLIEENRDMKAVCEELMEMVEGQK